MQIQQQQAIQQKIAADLSNVLAGQAFPEQHISRPIELGQWLNIALRHHTADTMGCSYEQFKEIWDKDVLDFTLQEMGIALNALTSSTCEQLRCTGHEAYFDIQEHARDLAAKWNAIVKPLREAIERKHSLGLITNEKKLITH